VYSAGRANEQAIQWAEDLWTLHSFLEPSIEQLDRDVEQIRCAVDADSVVMTLSDYQEPWRKLVMPSYKSNRKEVRKPVCYRPLREYVHEKYLTYQRPGLEGDDLCGIILTTDALFPGEKVAVSLDKDFNTIPGLHVNLKKAQEHGEWFPRLVTEAQANYYHLYQALIGDTVDGYPGCPGVGPVSGAKLLAPCCHRAGDDDTIAEFDTALAWTVIVAAYAKKGLGEEVALQNARVARICRHEDYDFDKREVVLWQKP